VDEFEYIYVFWKPGVTKVDRNRLTRQEWINWGSRAVWTIPSVRANDDHEAKFPLELPRRLIQLLTDPGDLVLDAFVGSGTTAVAAILEGRRYIGVDNQPEYVALARKACEKAQTLVNNGSRPVRSRSIPGHVQALFREKVLEFDPLASVPG
jgi:site-specific DNA-methyltransferase (adenine-specific)